jgi:FkbM family methyltransferase
MESALGMSSLMPTLRQRITSSVTRRYPFLSGCGTFANSRLVGLLAGDRHGLAWSRLKSGAEILVPLDDYIGRAAYFVGDLDRKISEVIKRIVRPGDRVLDIGANLGLITLTMAKLVGQNGRVDSFEPNPSIHGLLSRSIERNNLKNIRLHTCALGVEDGGTLTLTFPGHNAGMGTLSRTHSDEGWSGVQVPVRTLSSLAAEFDFGGVRLMKIDVEGFEMEVLRGALPWLSASPPEAIVFESNETRNEGESDPVLSLLAERGYAFYSIPKELYSLRLAPYRLGDDRVAASHDMLALRKDGEREIVSRFTVRA